MIHGLSCKFLLIASLLLAIAFAWIERPFILNRGSSRASCSSKFTNLQALSSSDWDEGYKKFLQFIEREGHSHVNLQCAELALWVRNQRRYYKQYQAGDSSPLTSERLQLLRSANFTFDVDEERWLCHYRDLCQYIQEHGHCRVPLTYSSLGQWVSLQRMQYKKKRVSGINGTLTEERIELLQQQNFIWDVSTWVFDQRILELKNFTEAGGQLCDIKSSDGEIGKWLATQKKEYKKYLLNQTNKLTMYHLSALEGVGFTPNLIKIDGQIKDPVDIDWADRMHELTIFYEEHGHTIVPRGGAGSLGQWVRKVRERMGSGKGGGTTSPSKQSRIQDLERVNFIWDPLAYRWDKQYQNLLQYRRDHGHCNVPSAHSDLGLWVSTQRREYAKLCAGNFSQMSVSRLERLEKAGFEWSRVPVVISRNEKQFQNHVQNYLEWRKADGAAPSRTLELWMERHRSKYRKWLRGEFNALREDRRAILEEIGLVQDIQSMGTWKVNISS